MNIKETFKQFCKERHEEDKGKNFDLLQEVYAGAELFDLSLIEVMKDIGQIPYRAKDHVYIVQQEEFKGCLPFATQFIQVEEGLFLFIREFSPTIITGSIYSPILEIGHKYITHSTVFHIIGGVLTIDANSMWKEFVQSLRNERFKERAEELLDSIVKQTIQIVTATLRVICNLPKYGVVSDKTNNGTTEYYRRKKANTIKVIDRPIYYVLQKEEETKPRAMHKIQAIGKLEFTHSFKVRGHYRKISPSTYGKDRNGNYNILGMTYVKEHVRGEGELVRRIRVLK